MAVNDIFSKRQRRARGEVPQLYRYDNFPSALRVQTIQLIDQAIPDNPYTHDIYGHVHELLCREYGLFDLSRAPSDVFGRDVPRSPSAQLRNFILETKNPEYVLDVVETLFSTVLSLEHGTIRDNFGPRVEDAITELNVRFREHGIGYQLESGEIIRMDSTLLHQDIVKPALVLLHDPTYANAETEFLRAHNHYRHGRHEEALTDALKALESTIKIICHRRKWLFEETATATKLLDVVFSNDLVPPYLQSHFSALRSTLECGVPTIRNKQSGHGAGTTARDVPAHLAAYTLHLTASAILFLAECDAALPQLP